MLLFFTIFVCPDIIIKVVGLCESPRKQTVRCDNEHKTSLEISLSTSQPNVKRTFLVSISCLSSLTLLFERDVVEIVYLKLKVVHTECYAMRENYLGSLYCAIAAPTTRVCVFTLPQIISIRNTLLAFDTRALLSSPLRQDFFLTSCVDVQGVKCAWEDRDFVKRIR